MPAHLAGRVLVETLEQTKDTRVLNLSEISRAAGTNTTFARKTLRGFIHSDDISSKLEPFDRFILAQESARLGMISEAARALTWQEFEAFIEDCLIATGFQTQKGVVVKDARRNWQVDVTGRKGAMILALDCKHWKPPNYSSKFKKPAEHQRLAVSALLSRTKNNRDTVENATCALPVIVTLFDPPTKILDGVVLVSVGQLSDFLQHVTPYEPDLPFIKFSSVVENPFS